MQKRILFVLVSLTLVACTPPPRAHAQFIGYVSPQTVQQNLGTAIACTGTAQTFPINNLGQTQHYLSIASVTGAQKFQAEIDGIDRQGNVYRLSDLLENSSALFARQGTVYGAGYYPQIQILVTCSPNTATFTASYSGAWATNNGNAGAYLSAQIDKIDFFQAPANVNQSDIFQTPFGSSAGTLYFQYNTTSVAGGTLSVVCSTNGIATPTAFSVTLPNTTALQVFQVPDTACPFATVNYISPGGGTSVSAEYVLATPGLSAHASTDPCASGSLAKTSVPIVAGAAATTQQIALVTGSSIYVCGYQMSQVATAGTLQWVYGTGTNCGTGTTTITGAMGVTASQPITYGAGSATVFKVPMSNELCLTTTGTGGSAAGIVTFIQSP
jgi:hypothetical protein